MNCSDLDELLSAYANGELSRTQREFIEEHLSSCADCRAALADYTEVRQQLMYLKATPSMPDLNEATMSKIRAAKYAPLKADGRKGIGSFIPNRLNWKTGLISILALAIVVSLAVTIPPFFRQGDKALAAEIALSNPEVQAVLGGENPTVVEVQYFADMNTGDEYTIVVIDDGHVRVVVDLNTGNAEVVTAQVTLELDEFARQEIIDIAKTDPSVQELFDKGAQVHDIIVVKVYPAIVDVWDAVPIPDIEINPEDLIGYIASLTLELDQNYHTVIVNLTTEKVVDIVDSVETIISTTVIKGPVLDDATTTPIADATTTPEEEKIQVSVKRISNGEEITLTPSDGIDRILFTDFAFIVDFNSAIKTGNGENALVVYLPFWEEWADTSVQVFYREGLYLTPLPEFDPTNEVSVTIEILDGERIMVSLVSGNFPSEAQVVLTLYFGEFGPPNQPSAGLGYTARVYVTADME